MFQQLLDPPVLFFVLGLAAIFLRSDLVIPESISKFLSMYLLMAIGFKGGVALSANDISGNMFLQLGAAVAMSCLIPLIVFPIMRSRLGLHDSAAVAATYGSVSAVTFIAATSWLEARELVFGGHLAAGLALMEAPPILVAIFLARSLAHSGPGRKKINWGHLLHESLLNGSVLLLMGSLLIGLITGPSGALGLHTLVYDLFKGFLCFFLLDMGLAAGRQIKALKDDLILLLPFSIFMPLLNASIAYGISRFIHFDPANLLLFVVLCSSASYIAVPAALNQLLPEAKSARYLGMALGLTFPFNILIGIPLYAWVIGV